VQRLNLFIFYGVILPSLEAGMGIKALAGLPNLELLGAILTLWEEFGEIY